ncbi:protein of unknown function [Methylocella tundrae]|uniref:Uncharacterized protein n=1 Tax=Methylocella tundrae TaxID=227605 RepID=A0A4U8YTY9_METTU|nr:protein of unknown function [Methylocella tundrae]
MKDAHRAAWAGGSRAKLGFIVKERAPEHKSGPELERCSNAWEPDDPAPAVEATQEQSAESYSFAACTLAIASSIGLNASLARAE